MEVNYRLLCLLMASLFIAMPAMYSSYKGFPVILDDIAQTRIEMPLEDVSCISEFNEQMEGLKMQ